MNTSKLAERNKRRRQSYAIAKNKNDRTKLRKRNAQNEIGDTEKCRLRKQKSRDKITKDATDARYVINFGQAEILSYYGTFHSSPA